MPKKYTPQSATGGEMAQRAILHLLANKQGAWAMHEKPKRLAVFDALAQNNTGLLQYWKGRQNARSLVDHDANSLERAYSQLRAQREKSLSTQDFALHRTTYSGPIAYPNAIRKSWRDFIFRQGLPGFDVNTLNLSFPPPPDVQVQTIEQSASVPSTATQTPTTTGAVHLAGSTQALQPGAATPAEQAESAIVSGKKRAADIEPVDEERPYKLRKTHPLQSCGRLFGFNDLDLLGSRLLEPMRLQLTKETADHDGDVNKRHCVDKLAIFRARVEAMVDDLFRQTGANPDRTGLPTPAGDDFKFLMGRALGISEPSGQASTVSIPAQVTKRHAIGILLVHSMLQLVWELRLPFTDLREAYKSILVLPELHVRAQPQPKPLSSTRFEVPRREHSIRVVNKIPKKAVSLDRSLKMSFFELWQEYDDTTNSENEAKHYDYVLDALLDVIYKPLLDLLLHDETSISSSHAALSREAIRKLLRSPIRFAEFLRICFDKSFNTYDFFYPEKGVSFDAESMQAARYSGLEESDPGPVTMCWAPGIQETRAWDGLLSAKPRIIGKATVC